MTALEGMIGDARNESVERWRARNAAEATTVFLGEPAPVDPPSDDEFAAWMDAVVADTDALPDNVDPPTWREIDPGPAWRGERPEPDAVALERGDGRRLLAPGINYLFGDSGDGKSWVAMFAALACMRAARHVVWITYEDPNEVEIIKRLKALGATFDDLTHLSLIVAIEPLTSGIGWLARLVRLRQTALLVLDSVGEALAVEGVDEDRDAEFGPWARSTLRTLIDLAASDTWSEAEGTPANGLVAVLPIDHSTKAKDNPFYPSGTKRKRAMVTGAMYMLLVREPFSIERVGRVQLIAAKDRTGRFRRGEIAAEVMMDATLHPYAVTIDAPPDGAEMSQTGKKRTAVDRVLQALEMSNVALSAEEAHRQVNHDTNRLPGEGELSVGAIKNALTKLAKRPNVVKKIEPNGVGNAVRHLYTVTDHECDVQVTP